MHLSIIPGLILYLACQLKDLRTKSRCCKLLKKVTSCTRARTHTKQEFPHFVSQHISKPCLDFKLLRVLNYNSTYFGYF